MQRGSVVTVGIHPDAIQTGAMASNNRVVMVTAKVGTHDAGHANAKALVEELIRELWDAPYLTEQDGWSSKLATISSNVLRGGRHGAFLSFTVVLLDNGRARIWNCGGHRVAALSASGAAQAAMDGFADTSHELLRTVVREAAGPHVPVPKSVIHEADVDLAKIRLLVISPDGQLLSIPSLGECGCVEDLVRLVERESPGIRYAFVTVAAFGGA